MAKPVTLGLYLLPIYLHGTPQGTQDYSGSLILTPGRAGIQETAEAENERIWESTSEKSKACYDTTEA